jgi:hypothetical protein
VSVKIKCEVFWIYDAVNINKNFDKDNDKYQLTICNLSDKAVEHLKTNYNIWCRNDKEGQGFYFRAKSKYPFKFKTNDGEVGSGVVGNSSKAIVTVTGSYEHKFSKKYGNGAKIADIVEITELVAPVTKEGKDGAPFEDTSDVSL